MQSLVRPIARRSFLATGASGAVPTPLTIFVTSKPSVSILCSPVSRMRAAIWTPPARLAEPAHADLGQRPARAVAPRCVDAGVDHPRAPRERTRGDAQLGGVRHHGVGDAPRPLVQAQSGLAHAPPPTHRSSSPLPSSARSPE